MIAFERAIAGELARRGPVSDETFRWIRKAAGLERGDLAQVLGVTPETIAGWEGERRPIDRAAWLLVAAMVLDGIEGPKPMRIRLRAQQRRTPSTPPAEQSLELQPGAIVARILSMLTAPTGFTDVDIADALDVDRAALRTRLREIAAVGLLSQASPDEEPEQRWTPMTRDPAALVRAAIEAGVDLEAPLPRATRDEKQSDPRVRTVSPTWRVTSS
jgi:DNA-binding transcriptional regulator YiaG